MANDSGRGSHTGPRPAIPDEPPQGPFDASAPRQTPRTHRVGLGDTLSKLANDYHVTIESFVITNHIQDARLLWVGQVLTIPRAASPIVPHPTPSSVPATAPPRARRNEGVPRPHVTPARTAIVSAWAEVKGETLQSTLALEEMHSLVTTTAPDELLTWLRLIFGEDIPPTAFQRLRADILQHSLAMPRLVIVRDELDGHPAAYHGKSRSILISRALVCRARGDNNEAWKLLVCLVEEFGHHLDHLLRTHYSSVGGDALMDEGTRVAYALIDFGHDRNQRRRVFAHYTHAEGAVDLEVEFSKMTEAVQQYVSAPEQWEDARSSNLEYFGAGRGSGRKDSYGHESIEDALDQAGFRRQARAAVYFGNWLRDHSQFVDPKLVRKKGAPVTQGLSREAITRIVDVMAREKFGAEKQQGLPVFRVDTQRLGVYRNEEHIDNPSGITDARAIDPAFRGACRPEELAINAMKMKNFIRSANGSVSRSPNTQRVKDGDTLESIARAHGLSWQELARYNFGTEVKDEVSRQLYTKVGCRKKTHDGRSYIFTSQDTPGLLRIPGGGGSSAQEASYSAFHYMSTQLRTAVKLGRTGAGYRHFGHALHTLEDFFSHTNFVELMLIQHGVWVEPWVPSRSATAGNASSLPLTSGQFGGLDTLASLTLGIAESMQKEQECIAGEMTAGAKIALILLDDQGYTEVRDLMGGLLERLHELEKAYPTLATLSCETVGVMLRAIKAFLGRIIYSAADLIDDAQTAFLSDPTSTNPTHTQLAKDHDEHPLHALAADLAAHAVMNVGKRIQAAWSGEATADDVVLAASHFFLHPSLVDLHGSAGWMHDRVRIWIPGHHKAIARLGKGWAADWTAEASRDLNTMMARARALMGKGRP